MTPKEKVLNLIENSYDIIPDDGTILLLGKDKAFEIAKKCALIAVDEKIKLYNELNEYGLLLPNSFGLELHEIKTEIEKL